MQFSTYVRKLNLETNVHVRFLSYVPIVAPGGEKWHRVTTMLLLATSSHNGDLTRKSKMYVCFQNSFLTYVGIRIKNVLK